MYESESCADYGGRSNRYYDSFPGRAERLKRFAIRPTHSHQPNLIPIPTPGFSSSITLNPKVSNFSLVPGKAQAKGYPFFHIRSCLLTYFDPGRARLGLFAAEIAGFSGPVWRNPTPIPRLTGFEKLLEAGSCFADNHGSEGCRKKFRKQRR